MKSKYFLASAFALAIVGSFAFKTMKPPVTAFYNNGTDCLSSALTNESTCTTATSATPCTVTVNNQTFDAFATSGVKWLP